ncbi:MAG: hypothetical protein GY847_30360 [Proteobacteria bacterium]|nr:hypothetical protein [Pseudomonadota bacterium]
MNSPRRYGRKTARGQDRIFDQARTVRRTEARLFDAPSAGYAKRPNKNRYAVPLLAAAVAAVMISATIFWLHRPPAPLSVTIDGTPSDLTLHHLISLNEGKETTVGFSDGSQVRLEKATRARLITLSDRGSDVLIENGRLNADIASTPKSNWRFHAGPFEVRVTGTRFVLDWNQQNGALSVAMEEGSVEILGPLSEQPRRVTAGETFRGWADKGRVEIVPNRPIRRALTSKRDPDPTAAPEMPTIDTEEVSVSTDEERPATKRAVSPSKTDPQHSDPPTVSSPSPVCPDTDAALALVRADTIRRMGATGPAESAYLEIRRCFAGTNEAALAAFSLGKVAFDNRRNWEDAARWFKTYLDEQQGVGPAREALGRLMEAYVNSHQPQRARETAQRYLDAYSDGPHASFATSIIEEDADSTTDP